MNFYHFGRKQVLFAVFGIASFGAGLIGAETAFNLDKHIAVSQARAAAVELEERQAELNQTLASARQVSVQASDVSHEDDVVVVAAELDAVAVEAEAVASQAPVLPEDEQSLNEPKVSDVTAPITYPEGARIVADDLSTSVEPEPQTPTEADEAIANALEGKLDDPEEAREAKAAIEAAVADLETAAVQVDATTSTLAALVEVAQHDANLAQIEAIASDSAEQISLLTELAPALEEKVDNTEVLVNAEERRATLQDALEADYDSEDSSAVTEYVTNLTQHKTAFDDAMAAVEESHTAWVSTENASRSDANDEAAAAYDAAYDEAWTKWTNANVAAVNYHSNGWSGTPTGVSGTNGNVAASELCEVDFASGHYLQCNAAESLERADDAYYEQTGHHLGMTDSYRSYGSQVATRAAKGYMAAIPGTSNHGWGMAVDLEYDAATWLAANGAEYGWVHPNWARSGGSKPEWWHLEYVAPSVGDFSAPEKPTLADPVKNLFGDTTKTDAS
ncbi:M15 family metallopeptidase [Demequina sediminicola]|uniref:M15 family metallopeptidase n=1 Tax=Demequina sediminicola TaxID=1095026 RepID=UPI0007826683|nr:M15 family metallopeptidase [Demequina sediminicola]